LKKSPSVTVNILAKHNYPHKDDNRQNHLGYSDVCGSGFSEIIIPFFNHSVNAILKKQKIAIDIPRKGEYNNLNITETEKIKR